MFPSSHIFVFWYFGHFICMIFFPVFIPLAHLALQNVNKDYIIFLFFATLLPKVTKKDKQKMGWLGTARALKDQDRIEKERYTMSVTSVMYSGPSEIKLQRGFHTVSLQDFCSLSVSCYILNELHTASSNSQILSWNRVFFQHDEFISTKLTEFIAQEWVGVYLGLYFEF